MNMMILNIMKVKNKNIKIQKKKKKMLMLMYGDDGDDGDDGYRKDKNLRRFEIIVFPLDVQLMLK